MHCAIVPGKERGDMFGFPFAIFHHDYVHQVPFFASRCTRSVSKHSFGIHNTRRSMVFVSCVCPAVLGGGVTDNYSAGKKTLPQHLRFRAELRHNLATPTRQDASNTFEDSCSPLDRSSNTYVEGARQSSGIAHLSVIIYTYLNNDRKSTFILCKC